MPLEQLVSVDGLCPKCGSESCSCVWVEHGQSVFVCDVCGCEFQFYDEERDDRVSQDFELAPDISACVQYDQERSMWDAFLYVSDEVVGERSDLDGFDTPEEACAWVASAKDACEGVMSGGTVRMLNDGAEIAVENPTPYWVAEYATLVADGSASVILPESRCTEVGAVYICGPCSIVVVMVDGGEVEFDHYDALDIATPMSLTLEEFGDMVTAKGYRRIR